MKTLNRSAVCLMPPPAPAGGILRTPLGDCKVTLAFFK